MITVLCGIPASGKSYYTEKPMDKPTITISSDEIREKVFGDIASQRYNRFVFSIMRMIAEKAILTGIDIFIDSTNIQVKHRKQWIDMAQKYECNIICIFVNPPVEVCLERNKNRERTVPEHIILEMHNNLEYPTIEEGFSQVIVYQS